MISIYCRHCLKTTQWDFVDGWWECTICGYGVPFGSLLTYERRLKK